ncbi:MAG: TonB-dependent receptor, partial [Candidatus Marinimicrobia bacterium]|nr:TonB-dependent receptor [Candidatus Neomarinimicrobiota bacterium]
MIRVLCGFLISATTIAFGQSRISGRIIDAETNQPLASADVVLEGTGTGANSDLSGNYLIIDIEPGEYQLIVSYIGYKKAVETFSIAQNQNLTINFYLQQTVLEAEMLVVTGTRVEVARKNVPLTISVISNDEIRQSNASALLPVLSERVPGVFVTERGITGFGVAEGAAGNITVRGVGGSPNTQVLMLIDGSPQFMGIFGHPLPDAYVASDVERIEVIRGPASILYGTGAMGGVVNLITKKQKADGLTINSRMILGSYNTQKYMGSGGYKLNDLNVFASINHDRTDGHRENSDFEIYNGYLKAGYTLSPHISMAISGNAAKFKTNDPGTISSPHIEEKHWLDITRGMASLAIDNRYDKIAGGLKLFYSFGEHDIYDGFHSTDMHRGLAFYQGLTLFPNNIITVGVDYKNYGGKAENIKAMMGEGIVFADTSVNEIGAYAFVQHFLMEKLILNAGLRLENHSEYGKETVPQAGFALHVAPMTTVKGSVSKGFRSPSLRELYLWAYANPDLEPERMWNYEVGVIQYLADNRLSFGVTGFMNEGKNLIQMVGQYPDVKHWNTGEFSHRGVELQGNY